MTAAIADQLFADPHTAEALVVIAALGVQADLPVEPAGPASAALDWPHLLSVASVLAAVPEERAQEAALRIVQGCLLLADDEDPRLKQAAAVMLERTGNRRSLDLAARRALVDADAWTTAPGPLMLDVIRRRLELSVPGRRGERLPANAFQTSFWTAASNHAWVSVSAPTSAGKSFIVRQWLAVRARRASRFRAAYVVPTRALIEEVSSELERTLDDRTEIFSIPWDDAIGKADVEIYVMTQERLNLLLGRHPALSFDVLFVDEAQKFGDEQRGVLLQQVVEEVARRGPATQVLLASPLTDNPGLLLESAPKTDTTPVAMIASTVTVNQNLLWADQVFRKPRQWELHLATGEDLRLVGHFELPARPQPASKRLPWVAVALTGEESGTVVYASTPSEAEASALQIHDLLGAAVSRVDDEEVAALRELVRTTVHRKYALVTALERGVAFHYGSMPQLIRHEIERLFREGRLRYLVCTSTLLEGVNLPCRLLLARKPQTGSGTPMSAANFWNLAGRAGRWGTEFQGNIVCVDPSQAGVWSDPPRRRVKQHITRASDARLADAPSLISYVREGAPAEQAQEEPLLEAVFSFVAYKILTGQELEDLPALSPAHAEELEDVVREALEGVDLPDDVVISHAGISPVAQQRLLEEFRASAVWEALMLPTAEQYNSAGAFADALEVCNRVLGADFGGEKRLFQIALLVVDWMRGLPLSVIIEKRLTWLRTNGRQFREATEIRNVMRDVEREARFAAPKYLACYGDVLRHHLQQIGEHDAAADLPDISMMLELGVARTTEVSMMSLGLSRTTVTALSAFIAEDELGRDECREWLRTHDLDGYGLPALVLAEVERVLKRDARRRASS